MTDSEASQVPRRTGLLQDSLVAPDFRQVWAKHPIGAAGYVDPRNALQIYMDAGLATTPPWPDEIVAHESMHSQLLTSTALGHVAQWSARYREVQGFDSLNAGCMSLSWHGQECAAMIAGYVAYHTATVANWDIGESFAADLSIRAAYAARYNRRYAELALRGLRLADVCINASQRMPLTFVVFANALGQFSLNTDIIDGVFSPFLSMDPPLWRAYLDERPNGLVKAERQSGTRLLQLEQAIHRRHRKGEFVPMMVEAGRQVFGAFASTVKTDVMDFGSLDLATRTELADNINAVYLQLLHDITGIAALYRHSFEIREHIDAVLGAHGSEFGGIDISRDPDRWTVIPTVSIIPDSADHPE